MLHLERERDLFDGSWHDADRFQTQTYAGFIKGVQFLQQEKNEIAIGCFTTSIGLLPKRHMYIFRAIAFVGFKMYAKAISDCDIIVSDTTNDRIMLDVIYF
jgi:hypothetical protein